MNITLSSPIAQGRTADIYAWQDHTILKLYRDWCPAEWATYESKIANAVTAAGIPAPAAGELVEVNGRHGLIYERITGISMLQEMNTRPWTLLKNARTLAELQVKINRLSIPGLPSAKDGLVYRIRHVAHLDDILRDKVLARLATLPDGDKVCHGDFHPDNVLLTDNGPVVIDWMTASSGNPWADVARTSMILSIGAKHAGEQVNPVIRLLIDFYQKAYLKHYFKLIPDSANEVEQWMPVIAAARLDEQIEPERESLIKMVRDGLGG